MSISTLADTKQSHCKNIIDVDIIFYRLLYHLRGRSLSKRILEVTVNVPSLEWCYLCESVLNIITWIFVIIVILVFWWHKMCYRSR